MKSLFRLIVLVIALSMIAVFSTTALSQAAIVPGEYEKTIVVGGETRDYILHIPPGYDGSKAVALVFVLHPYGASAKTVEKTSDMSVKADKEGFVVIYPNGTGNPRAWNAGFFPLNPTPADDVAFISALMDKLEKDLRIDGKRIYVCGFSNGAFMTYRLGAVLSGRIAAIAVVEGSVGAKQPNGSILMILDPSSPVPIIVFHGKEDRVVPYNGGPSSLPGNISFLSVADSVGFWLKHDGCTAAPNTKTSQNGNIIETDYTGCIAGSEVVLVTIGNGKHDWPSAALPDQISATDSIWEFFARHQRQ